MITKAKPITWEFPFEIVGRYLINTHRGLKLFFEYTAEFFYALVTPPLRIKETIIQLDQIGVRSAPIVLFSVSFAAAVTIMEYAFHMKLVIQTSALVPGFAALLVFRELGAIITALLLTSRVGAGITAEVGTMKITEQIEALRLLNVEPMRYIVIPRFWASLITCMALVILANATCLFFEMVVSVYYIGLTPEIFLKSMNTFATYQDFLLAIVKGGVFGSVIPVISCFFGFNCKAGAEGVGNATTRSVVTNAVTIIILNFILTYLFSYLY